MKESLTAAIAWRYLKSKKSHGAVGTITTVSVCAMAIATAAIICVLSVFNGFREIIGTKLDTLSPDILATPASGKVFADAEQLAASLDSLPEVALSTPTLSDNALAIANSKEMPVNLKGVYPEAYSAVTSIKALIPEDYGKYFSGGKAMSEGEPVEAILAVGTASRLLAYPGTGVLIFAPKREGRVNMANPGASFLTDSINCMGIYRTDQQQFDDDGLFIPIDAARRLFMYGNNEASALEIRVSPGTDTNKAMEAIAAKLGNGFIIKDRLMQQEMNFRMVSIEKWMSFLLLVFILLIACFNIISALSMLVIEKEEGIGTLAAMGLSQGRIGKVFAWESIYVSATGGLIGIVLGVGLCLIQQYFGIIKIGAPSEALIVSAYPVVVRFTDILITLIPVTLLGLLTAAVTAAFARSKAGTDNIRPAIAPE